MLYPAHTHIQRGRQRDPSVKTLRSPQQGYGTVHKHRRVDILILLIYILISEGRRGAGTQWCEYKATVVSLIPPKGNKLLFNNNFFTSLWHQGKSLVLSSATQRAMPQKCCGK